GPPSRYGVIEAGGDLLRRPRDQRRASHLAVAEREDGGLPGGQADPAGRRVAGDVEADRRGQQQPVSATPGGHPSLDLNQERADEPVFRPGRVADLRVHLTIGAGQPAEQDAGRSRTQVMAAVVTAEREGVGEYRGATRGGERGLQHHRLVHIPAAGPNSPDGWIANRPPAGSSRRQNTDG